MNLFQSTIWGAEGPLYLHSGLARYLEHVRSSGCSIFAAVTTSNREILSVSLVGYFSERCVTIWGCQSLHYRTFSTSEEAYNEVLCA